MPFFLVMLKQAAGQIIRMAMIIFSAIFIFQKIGKIHYITADLPPPADALANWATPRKNL